MARPPRVCLPGLPHHVIQRGNNRVDIFRTTEDYVAFLSALGDALRRFDVTAAAYVLMTNHVHLMLVPSTAAGIPRVMQAVGRRYVPRFNDAYGRTGGLYEGRYRCFVVEDETYWFSCARYIEENPVRAGMVPSPGDYKWSSFAAHAAGAPDPILQPHPSYLALGPTPAVRQAAWRAICGPPLSAAEREAYRESERKRRRA